MHSQPAPGHASDGWNQHNNNKSTECTHSVVYMYECGGGDSGGGGGGEWGRGSFTYILLLLIFDVGSHHPLAETAPRFSCTFFSSVLPKQRSQHERKAICGHHSQADVYVTLSCHPKTCNNILPCPHFTYCTERSLCKLLSISSVNVTHKSSG